MDKVRIELTSKLEDLVTTKFGHWSYQYGDTTEISKEHLLELANHARSRNEIALEQELFQAV